MNAPNIAWNEVWTRNRRTRIRVAVDQLKRRRVAGLGSKASVGASAAAAAVVRAGPSAFGFGRNNDAIAAVVLVKPTTRNGSRRSATPTSSPPTVGPSTVPAEPAADRTPFANASGVRWIAWATYRRSATWLTPAPSPASERKAIS